jgi:anti-sigma regulatory factor (Ser/Thr protein kinase)
MASHPIPGDPRAAGAPVTEPSAASARLEHTAAFYSSPGEYLDQVLAFVTAGLARAEPVLVAVPGPNIGLLREGLDRQADQVGFADMTAMGANPAWIIPRVRAFVDAHPGPPVRYVGEPIWETRTPAELTEATRHEALINLAFAGTAARILCPYDASRLAPGVIANAERTHPRLIRGGQVRPSDVYTTATLFPADCDQPLPAPPAGAASLTYRDNLAGVRAFVTEHAVQAGLPAGRAADLVIAVSELAANTVRHTAGDGVLHIWATGPEVLCQVRDTGYIGDPLVGRRPLPPDAGNGHGLRVVHQICDLVELRTSSTSGTTIRLHMRRPADGGQVWSSGRG